jgi:hypothetical protein
MSSTTWPATRIASPFPTTGSYVTFRWKDYAHKGKRRLMTVTAHEFLRRFLLHTLPRGFVRIRFYGFLANRRRRELLPLCRRLLEGCRLTGSTAPAPPEPKPPCAWLCPLCGGRHGPNREANPSADPLEIG